jgi:hypothetical protein
MQTLYYIPASSSLSLRREDGNTDYWLGVSSLVTSASIYQIVALSGSAALAYFPINNTNVYYEPFPVAVLPLPSGTASLSTVDWVFTNNLPTTSAFYSIQDTTATVYYVSSSGISNAGGFGLYQSHSYKILVSASVTEAANFTASIYINDINSGSVIFASSSINTPISTSFSPLDFKYYQITMSVTYGVEV